MMDPDEENNSKFAMALKLFPTGKALLNLADIDIIGGKDEAAVERELQYLEATTWQSAEFEHYKPSDPEPICFKATALTAYKEFAS